MHDQITYTNSKLDQYLEIFESTITSESGTVTKRAAEKGATTSVMVNFSAPFLKVPTVTLSLEKAVSYNGRNLSGYITLSTADISKTSFVIKIVNKHGSDNYWADCTIKWNAECDLTS